MGAHRHGRGGAEHQRRVDPLPTADDRERERHTAIHQQMRGVPGHDPQREGQHARNAERHADGQPAGAGVEEIARRPSAAGAGRQDRYADADQDRIQVGLRADDPGRGKTDQRRPPDDEAARSRERGADRAVRHEHPVEPEARQRQADHPDHERGHHERVMEPIRDRESAGQGCGPGGHDGAGTLSTHGMVGDEE
ncbi:MAG: hypothetical protein DHS20C19_29100 [Acidimicrobiales bacterium]|nr:MAG: hypothetical protein DHS20C19_29100 [Acidimicrobiales bacterium]